MTIEHNEARRYLRFPPDPAEVAYIDCNSYRDGAREPFSIDVVALIVDVAPKGGCSLVFMLSQDLVLEKGQRCRIKVGDMLPVIAEVIWKREIDPYIYRCGFIFLE